jgi:hypothetical protein
MRSSLCFAGALLFTTAIAARSETNRREENPSNQDGDRFVVVMTEEDSSAEAVFERYPEVSGSWEELAKFNLLRSGHVIEIPRNMLTTDGVLAKVASHYGEVEVKRGFDRRFIPVVTNLLLREGDELRTWSGSGVRILFEDGNYVFVNSHTKVEVDSLGASGHTSGAARLRILLKEGSVWSQIEKQLRGTFEVKTSTANTIIRGTEFRVKVEAGDATRVEVLDGSVDFDAGGGAVPVGTRQGALAVSGDAPVSSVDLPPAPGALETPQPQEVIRGEELDQIFRWSPVAGAGGYHLVIAKDETFFDVVDERHVGREASIRIPSLEPGTYFWRVSTIGPGGFEGPFTESRYFVFVRSRP